MLLKRRSETGIQEIVRRARSFSLELREVVGRHLVSLAQPLRHLLLHNDLDLRDNTLELIREFEDYNQIGTLISLLEMREYSARDHASLVFQELIDHLYEHVKAGKESRTAGGTGKAEAGTGGNAAGTSVLTHQRVQRDAERIRLQVLSFLEQSCHRFDQHQCREIVEAMLILSDPENTHAQRIIREASDSCRKTSAEVLKSSAHPAIISLVFHVLTQNYPLPGAMGAFEQRRDMEFVCFLLRNWPRTLSVFQQKNLRQVQSLGWIDPADLHLEMIPAVLQKTLIACVLATGLPEEHKLAVLEWMVKYGSSEGRQAAAVVMMELEDTKVQDVVLESLQSEDAEVQAWATSQLRPREVPQAFAMLIQRLDSPMKEVQEAARKELGDFDIYRGIEMFDQLEPKVCLAVGQLVRKIDPQALNKLHREIVGAIRRRRIRAARGALALGLQELVAEALVQMTQDGDALVRRTAAEVLGSVSLAASGRPLAALLEDPSPRVREAARNSLQKLQGTTPSFPAGSEAEMAAVADSPAEDAVPV